MTKREFIENVNNWKDLIEVCDEYCCDLCADILYQNEFEEQVEFDLIDQYPHIANWHELRQKLNGLPEHSKTGYFYRDGPLNYSQIDDQDISGYKENVADWMEVRGHFDKEESEEIS